MGGKPSKTKNTVKTSLNSNERHKIITLFGLEDRLSDSINFQHINAIWRNFLVPDLLNTYTEFLKRQDSFNKNNIGLEKFVTLYRALVREDNETKALCFAALVSPSSCESGLISFNDLCKYLSDLLESYLKGAEYRNDAYYKSWKHSKQPERAVIEDIIKGICNDLPKANDDVTLSDLEHWLTSSGLTNALHFHVVSYMYNLQPEELSSLIPKASLPTRTCLNLPQVIFLNSLIPFENKSEWRFLFSNSIHGESFAKFVGCIINQGPLLLVLECDEKTKFGGFISENINPGPRWVGTEDSFLFKLTPRTEVFPTTGYNDHFAYLNTNQTSLPNGLGMGGQFDYWGLWIDSHFGDGECSESCTTYKNYNMIAKKKKFKIKNIEVWSVGDPPLSAAEKGERGPSSILDKDASASHILEMAGRQVYSKGLREDPKL